MVNKRIQAILAAFSASLIFLTSLVPAMPLALAAEGIDAVEVYVDDALGEQGHSEEATETELEEKEHDPAKKKEAADPLDHKASQKGQQEIESSKEGKEGSNPISKEGDASPPVQENTDDTEDSPFEIIHEPLTKVTVQEDIHFSVTVKGASQVNLIYQTGKGMAKEKLALEGPQDEGDFSITIPASEVTHTLWSPTFYYSIEAINQDGEGIETDIYEVDVELEEPTNAQEIPALLITELVVDTVNLNKKDAYEFVEIYNNTNQPIQMSDYQLIYRYPDGRADLIWTIDEDKLVAPQEAFIVWLQNPVNSHLTIQDLNQAYGLHLTEDKLAIVESVGLSNSEERTVIVADKAMNELVAASYLPEDVRVDQGIQYRYPESGTEMRKLGLSEGVTPTEVIRGQVPEEAVQVEQVADLAMDHTPIVKVNDQEAIQIRAEAANAAAVTVSYQTGKGMEAKELALKRQGDSDQFQLDLSADQVKELLWSPYFYYSLQARDHSGRTVKTDLYEVEVDILEELDSQQVPPLLITEITPDTVNVNGADAYEFIELYNNTNQAIKMSDYQLIYRYPDGKPDQYWPLTEDKVVDPQESFIVWIHHSANKHLSLDDFNAHYGLSLSPDRVTIVESEGLANGSERTLIVADRYHNEMVSATYNDDGRDVKVDQGIVYRYPVTGKKMRKLGIARQISPLEIFQGQVPKQAVQLHLEGDLPELEHHLPDLEDGHDLELRVKVTSQEALLGVNLHMTQSHQFPKKSMAMVETEEEGVYSITIPRVDLWNDKLYYHFTAANQAGESISESYELSIPQSDIDFQSLPELLITEIVPDSTNVNGLDGYEFIEIYNNTNQTIDFKDYVIRYRYPNVGKPGDLIWEAAHDGSMLIPSGGTIVLWVINSGNDHLQVADFNRHYGSQLVEGETIFRMYNNGMANGSERSLVIATKTGKEISRVSYNTDVNMKDVYADKGIVYRYPIYGILDGMKISAGEWDATPGKVITEQVPREKLQLEVDQEAPVIEDLTGLTEVLASESLTLKAKVTDNRQVKAVSLFYRTSQEDDFTQVNLETFGHEGYQFTISEAEFIGRSHLEYYFLASDGSQQVEMELVRLPIKQEQVLEGLRLNVKDKDLLSGTRFIKATADDARADIKVYVDDQALSNPKQALESHAFFTFEVRKTDLYFKNGVTMGDEILHIFDDTTNEYTTLMVPIEPEKLEIGKNTITVRAGTKVSPFDLESTENRDDFYMKNIRLILADGTIIRDPAYEEAQVEHAIGDSAGMDWIYDFNFTIDETHFRSQAYEWNTEEVEDGNHIVKAIYGEEEVTAEVIVDNTAPIIETTVEEGAHYKGSFTIDAEVRDEGSEVVEVIAKLNDNYISLPYETSSALLEAGEHQLLILAKDLAGNQAEKQIRFIVEEEHPHAPDKGEEQVEATEANLAVKVSDPTGDDLEVSFYEAFQYRADDEAMTISTHASDTEPPQVFRLEGEEPISTMDREKLLTLDGEGIDTESMEQFPYHRFDVQVDEKVDEDDRIEVVWHGASLPGRKVTMYAWNDKKEVWQALVSHIADEQSFSLIGEVIAKDYVRDGQVSVIVQDEIASMSLDEQEPNLVSPVVRSEQSSHDFSVSGNQFSFVWFTDTQYYSESYPHIYEAQVKWMVEQADALNLKYIFHSGDLVDKHYDMKQWEVADRNMKILDDAGIPYGVLAGNHDVGHKEIDYTTYYEYFGDHRFQGRPYFGGSYLNNRGHYDLISAEGNDFIMLYMGWGVDEAGIEWMNDVLSQYPNRKAILNFHEYLLASGSRSPIADKIYEEVVLPNDNVLAVLSGHYHNAQTLIDEIDDDGDGETDRVVYQMLADYQAGPEGGQGFLRILTFDPEANTMDVKTYSPYLDRFNFYDPQEFPGKDAFVVDFDLSSQVKKVATDFVEVNIYTNQLIGKVDQVPSGETATVVWKDLDPNQTYFWYVVAEDQYGGYTRSKVWSFMTKDGQVIDQPDEDIVEKDTPTSPGNNDQDGNVELDKEVDSTTEDKENDSGSHNDRPHGKDQGSGKAPDSESQKQDGIHITKDDEKTGGKLPNTATNFYNYIWLGISLLLISLISLYLAKRRQKEQA